jgi:uncharacterized membrane protein YgcG
VTRRLGYFALAVAAVAALAAGYVQATGPFPGPFPTTVLPANVVLAKVLLVVATVLGFYGVYVIVLRTLVTRFTKRRAHDVRKSSDSFSAGRRSSPSSASSPSSGSASSSRSASSVSPSRSPSSSRSCRSWAGSTSC